MRNKDQMAKALCKEIRLQKNYLDKEKIETIYFGGGTPSVFSIQALAEIMHTIQDHFSVSTDAEITVEANPDDLNLPYLEYLQQIIGANRLSIGVQSFSDKILQFLNRFHDAKSAFESISLARKSGFGNITIDLIYGIPGQTLPDVKRDLRIALETNIQHVSAYHLNIEPKTVFGRWQKKGKLKVIDESLSQEEFYILSQMLRESGFIQYEISNFGKEGYFSKHNMAYWQGKSYLGIGPSANSFNQVTRQWNISINDKYIQEVVEGNVPYTIEELDDEKRYNEYVLTSLRTMWGVDLDFLNSVFGSSMVDYFQKEIQPYLHTKQVQKAGNKVTLSDSGKLLADRIISDTMII